MQKFDGEDLNNKARTKFQNEQLREWAEQQMREKKAAEDAQNRADRLYELKMKELDQRAMELSQAEEECRRAINSATNDYNRAQVSNSVMHIFFIRYNIFILDVLNYCGKQIPMSEKEQFSISLSTFRVILEQLESN